MPTKSIIVNYIATVRVMSWTRLSVIMCIYVITIRYRNAYFIVELRNNKRLSGWVDCVWETG